MGTQVPSEPRSPRVNRGHLTSAATALAAGEQPRRRAVGAKMEMRQGAREAAPAATQWTHLTVARATQPRARVDQARAARALGEGGGGGGGGEGRPGSSPAPGPAPARPRKSPPRGAAGLRGVGGGWGRGGRAARASPLVTRNSARAPPPGPRPSPSRGPGARPC